MKKNKNNILYADKNNGSCAADEPHHHHSITNPNQYLFKIILSSMFLALSVGLSLIEIRVMLPWGVEFDFRIFDTVFLLLTLSITGLRYALGTAILQPWLHLMVDGAHSPVSMAFYMFSNIAVVFVFWIIYIKLFKAGSFTNKKKRVVMILLSSLLIIPLCAFVESSSLLFVSLIMVGIGASWPDGISGLFKGKNLLYSSIIFMSLFSFKYIIVVMIFSNLNYKTRFLAEHYGL